MEPRQVAGEAPRSPLAEGAQVRLLGEVATRDLLRIAKRWYGDFSYLFAGIDTLRLWECRTSGLKFFDPMVCGDAKFYEILDHLDWYYPDQKTEYQTAAAYVRSGDRVLDVGCGSGEFAKFLPAGASFRGLELSPPALARGVAAGRDIVAETIEAHSVRYPAVYDVVTAFQVIEHVSDPLAFLRAMLGCLKSGGQIIVATPNDESFIGLTINNLLNMPPHHVTRWPPRSLNYAMQACGVGDVELIVETLAPVHEEMFYGDLVLRALFGARRHPPPLLRYDLRFRVAARLARLLARGLLRGHRPETPLAAGHTILAVGRKPE